MEKTSTEPRAKTNFTFPQLHPGRRFLSLGRRMICSRWQNALEPDPCLSQSWVLLLSIPSWSQVIPSLAFWHQDSRTECSCFPRVLGPSFGSQPRNSPQSLCLRDWGKYHLSGIDVRWEVMTIFHLCRTFIKFWNDVLSNVNQWMQMTKQPQKGQKRKTKLCLLYYFAHQE